MQVVRWLLPLVPVSRSLAGVLIWNLLLKQEVSACSSLLCACSLAALTLDIPPTSQPL